jgi:hypothetical protein
MDCTHDIGKEQWFAPKRHDGTGRICLGNSTNDFYSQPLVYRYGIGISLILSYLAMFAVRIAPISYFLFQLFLLIKLFFLKEKFGYNKLNAIHYEKTAQ